MPEAAARLVVVQILSALGCLHYRRGAVFGRLRGDSVRFDEGGSVKLGPFGLTESDIEFAAPEILLDQAPTAAADIWGLGVLLFLMASGRLPFEGLPRGKVSQKILRDDPEFPVSMSPDLSDLIARMLDKDPIQRITIQNIQQHPWIAPHGATSFERLCAMDPMRGCLDEAVVHAVAALGYDVTRLAARFAAGAFCEATAAYQQLLRRKLAGEVGIELSNLRMADTATPRRRGNTSVPLFNPSNLSTWVRPRAVATVGTGQTGVVHAATHSQSFKKVEFNRSKAKSLGFVSQPPATALPITPPMPLAPQIPLPRFTRI